MWLKLIFWAIANAPELIGLIQALMRMLRSLPVKQVADIEVQLQGALASGNRRVIRQTVKALAADRGVDKK